MANSTVLFDSLAIFSFVGGHHVYKDIWMPSEGKVLQLQRELSNPKDRLFARMERELEGFRLILPQFFFHSWQENVTTSQQT